MIGFVPVMTHLRAREVRATYHDDTYGDDRPQTLLLWTANSNQHAYFPGDQNKLPIQPPSLERVDSAQDYWRLPPSVQDAAPNGSHHRSDWSRYPQIFDPRFPHRGFILRPSIGRESDPVLYTDLNRIPSSWEPSSPGSLLGVPSVAIVNNLCSRWKEVQDECSKRDGKSFRSFPSDASFHLFHEQSITEPSRIFPWYLYPISSLRNSPMSFADAQYMIESFCRGMREKLAWCRLYDRIQESPCLTNSDLSKVGGRAADDDLLGCWANRMEQNLLSFLFGCGGLPLFFCHISKGVSSFQVGALVVPPGPTCFTDFTDVAEELQIDLYKDLPDAPPPEPYRSGPHDLVRWPSSLQYSPPTEDRRWATREPQNRRPALDPKLGFLRRSNPLAQGWIKPPPGTREADSFNSRSESWFVPEPSHWDELVAPRPFEHKGGWTRFVEDDDPLEVDPVTGNSLPCMRKLGNDEDPDGRRYLVPQMKYILYLTRYDTPFGVKDLRFGSPSPRCNYFVVWSPNSLQYSLAPSATWMLEYGEPLSLGRCQSWIQWASKWQFHPRRLELFALKRTPLRKQKDVFLPFGLKAIGGVSQEFDFNGNETDDMFEFYNVVNPLRPPPTRKVIRSSPSKPAEPMQVDPPSVPAPAEPMEVDPTPFPALPTKSRFGPLLSTSEPLVRPVGAEGKTSYAQAVARQFQDRYGSSSSNPAPRATIEVFRPDPLTLDRVPITPVVVPAVPPSDSGKRKGKGKEKAQEDLSLVLPLNAASSSKTASIPSSSVSSRVPNASSKPRWSDYDDTFGMDEGPSLVPLGPTPLRSRSSVAASMFSSPSTSSLGARISASSVLPPSTGYSSPAPPSSSISLPVIPAPQPSRCMIIGNWNPELDEANWAEILSPWLDDPADLLILTRKVSPYQLIHIRMPSRDLARDAIQATDGQSNGAYIVRSDYARDLTSQERIDFAGESRVPPPDRRGKRHQQWRASNRTRILELYEDLRL